MTQEDLDLRLLELLDPPCNDVKSGECFQARINDVLNVLREGANPRCTTGDGYSAFEMCVMHDMADYPWHRSRRPSMPISMDFLKMAHKSLDLNDALMLACMAEGRVGTNLVEELLRMGANPDSVDKPRISATCHAAACNPESLKALLEAGALPRRGDLSKWAPLHMAGSAEAVRLLVTAGANPNEKAEKGESPLHTINVTSAAKEILRNGADPEAMDNDGETPLDTVWNVGVARALLSSGAKPTSRSLSNAISRMKDMHGCWKVVMLLSGKEIINVPFSRSRDLWGNDSSVVRLTQAMSVRESRILSKGSRDGEASVRKRL